jgi:AcrR family transcriptional regulator
MTAGYPRARARTRATLIEAARQVMAETGVEGASIATIAARAGVSPGTFYNYFPDLPAVLDALVDELLGYVDGVLVDVYQRRDLDHLERFAVAVDALLRLPDQDPAWAWCLVRFEPTVDRLRADLCERIARVPPAGRLRRSSQQDVVAADVLLGTLLTSMLSRLQGRADASHNHLVAQALLRAWGLSADEARAAAAVVRGRR